MKNLTSVDAVVIGAGIGGLYAVRRLIADGWSVTGFESAADVGGVWLHNAYPGARVDIEAYYYSYLDPEIYESWKWTERFPAQPEILSYLRHYADHYDLRRHFRFSTYVEAMRWDADLEKWRIRTAGSHDVLLAHHVVLATGQLSKSRSIPFEGVENFEGELLQTSHWPDRKVDFSEKRVAVIGTGSSGVQVTTALAPVVGSLHVFQRTPNYVVPSQNDPIDDVKYSDYAHRIQELRNELMQSSVGYPLPTGSVPAAEMTQEERKERLEQQWAFGTFAMNVTFPDQKSNPQAAQIVSEFVRAKMREVVKDPDVANILAPTSYPIGTRRLVVCDGYYDVFNRNNVTLINLRDEPIVRVNETGIQTTREEYEFDVIVSALGFDAFTGPVDAINIRNARGDRPADSWASGPHLHLGIMLHGFPNLYFLTGPSSPSVLVNFNLHNVFHVDFVADLMRHMKEQGYDSIQPTLEAQEAWKEESQEAAEGLLRKVVKNYMLHENDDGTRFFVPYAGGWGKYVNIVKQVEVDGYAGFAFNRRTAQDLDSDSYPSHE